MGGLVDAVLSLRGTAAYVTVGALAFGEAAAFVGLVLPGELAVLLGGVIASFGHASLPLMVTVAAVAAVAGDSAGYEVGRRFGPRILRWEPFARRFGDKVDRARAYMTANGGRAVFLGRWTSVLRALVPGIAGMTRMPYGRFLAFNVAGGVAWAATFVVAGFLAGASWRRFERIAGRASLLILVVVLLVVLVRWGIRRLLKRADALGPYLRRLAETPLAQRFAARYRRPIRWAAARLSPGGATGLGWTLWVSVTALATWGTGVVVQDLLAGEELVLLDRPVARWVTGHSTAAVRRAAGVIVTGTAVPWGVLAVAVVAVVVGRVRSRSDGLRVLASGLVAGLLAKAVAGVLPVSSAGTAFPGDAVALVTATTVTAATAVATADLVAGIRVFGAGLGVLVVVSVATLTAGVAALSGVVGGVFLGLLVAAGGELTARAFAN